MMKYELYAVDKAGIADLICTSDDKREIELAIKEYRDNEEDLSEIIGDAVYDKLFVKEWLS